VAPRIERRDIMTDPRPYDEWRTDPNGRWRDAFHAFGHMLLTHARDRVVADTPAENRELAARIATDTLYNLMMILEGVVAAPVGRGHVLDVALTARVRGPDGSIVEQFELAPDGEESVCMGFHLWTEGEFRE
jgi:hypothetical protein